MKSHSNSPSSICFSTMRVSHAFLAIPLSLLINLLIFQRSFNHIDDQARKGGTYANPKRYFHLQGEFQKEIEHNEKDLNIAREIDERAAEERG